MDSKYYLYWDLIRTSRAVSIADQLFIKSLGGDQYIYCEQEFVFSEPLAAEVYSVALKALKSYSKHLEFTKDLKMLADFAVIINGELSMGWNIKHKHLDSLDLSSELHFNTLSVKLHRKAAIAWEFRKILLSKFIDIPYNELETLKEISEIHKQNYYLWEYRRWVLNFKLTGLQKEEELVRVMDYCERNPSDSSSYHYLYECFKNINRISEGFIWIAELCKKYYGTNGLFNETLPPGYETLNLFRAKTRTNMEIDYNYYQEQVQLGRNPKFLYYK